MSNEHYGDDSDVDSLTEDLEKVGGFPSIAGLSSTFNFNLPSLSDFASLPNLSSLPNLAELPNLPDLPNLPNLPNLPELTQLKAFIKAYNDNTNNNVSTIKTSILSRIQMINFLNDLNLGLSFQTAVERLKPLADLIHQTINLPADVDLDEDVIEESLHHTEPVGVEPLVTKHQPVLNNVVVPRDNEIIKHQNESFKHPSTTENIQDKSLDGLTIGQIKELTEIESSKDFNNQGVLRTKIQKIQSLVGVTQSNKNKLVTRLMMGNYYKYLNEQVDNNDESDANHSLNSNHIQKHESYNSSSKDSEDSRSKPSLVTASADESDSEDEVTLTTHDKKPSYYNESEAILGCQHYQRKCKLECATCFQWYACRFCHDSESNHQMSSKKVKHILCMNCFEPQFPSSNCEHCEIEFANYYCDECVLYDDDLSKDIYHCDDCGICRLGLGLGQDFFHCKGCNACLSIDLQDSHKCMENSTQSNCPICGEYMFTSTKTVVFMCCGHSIHQSCFDEYTKHSYKCPLCFKTITNMEAQFRVLDQEISLQPLPIPYKNWRCIISCNDCKGKSNVSYHLLGLKCDNCNSYNTAQLKLLKPEEDDIDYNSSNREDHRPIIYSSNNLNSNFNIDGSHSDKVSGLNNNKKNHDYHESSSDEENCTAQNFIKFGKSGNILSNENLTSFTSVFNNIIGSSNTKDGYESYDSEDNIGGF